MASAPCSVLRWVFSIAVLTGCGGSSNRSSAANQHGASTTGSQTGGSGSATNAAGRSGAASESTAGKRSPRSDATTLADFRDGNWTLTVDRAWDGVSGNIHTPSDSFSEDDYKLTEPTTYAVVVSKSGAAVNIGAMPWGGTRKTASDQDISFELSEGTFAGGRFVVWKAIDSLQAELTMYGSGRPIVKSERGPLTAE